MGVAGLVVCAIAIGVIMLSCGIGMFMGVQAATHNGFRIPEPYALGEMAIHVLACIVTIVPLLETIELPFWLDVIATISFGATVFCVALARASAGVAYRRFTGKLIAGLHILRFPLALIPLIGMGLAASV